MFRGNYILAGTFNTFIHAVPHVRDIKQEVMSNTYTQVHLQLVFAVQDRMSLIHSPWKDELYKYITGIMKNHDHKPLIINGMPDHIHIVLGMRPVQSLSDLMQDIKGESSKWINKRKFVAGRFSWQQGYGAFSYSKGQLPAVINYVANQEAHHKNKTFREEYVELLKKYDVEYDERFIFHDVV